MPHAHLTVYHLIQQLESAQSCQGRRDNRPEWLRRVVESAAELFEPLEDLGRVGFICRPTAEGWVADLYLGSEEQFGGAEDGRNRPMNFRFDLARLESLFDDVAECSFDASATGGTWTSADESVNRRTRATIRGEIDDHRLTIHIHATPPADAKPGFRRHTDGHREMRD